MTSRAYPMSVIELYEKLSTAPDDKTRARIIAEAFEALEERYPNLSDIATRQNLRETELRLLKEIEQVRLEIEQVRSELTKEIEQVRGELTKEIEQVRSDLTREIEQTRADLRIEIEKVRSETRQVEARLRVEIEKSRTNILFWSFLFWATQISAIFLLLWRIWPKN